MMFFEALESRRLFAVAVPAGGFTESVFVSGISNATAMEIAPDGRIFVAQQTGELRVVDTSGQLLASPFMSLPVNSAGERGLLGVAFDPNFASNKFIYVYYTATSPTIHNRVSRFTANGNTVVAGSEKMLLDLPTLGAEAHNGGAIHFGPDGKLYIAVGENTVGSNSQSLATPLGKMLRINSDGSIPADNPFFNQTTGNNRAIWALGLRNPFTFGFQNGTGRMLIDDLGNVSFEEINDGIAGSNYGWPNSEGLKKAGDTATSIGTYRDPIFNYGRDVGNAITGGAFYNPQHAQFPAAFVGKYFFTDNGPGWIHQLNLTNNTASDFAEGYFNPVDLKVGAGGALYLLERGNGQIHRITYTSIQGRAFNDANSNNVRDANEQVLAGRTFYIDANNNGVKDAGEISDVSDSTGLFVLGGLNAGTYAVRQVLPSGWRTTKPTNATSITLATGERAATDFGSTTHILIAGTVFVDDDLNGTKGTNEMPLKNWKVFVDLDNDGTADANEPSKLTDANGNYQFQGLFAGTGTLRVQQQQPFMPASPSTGKYTGTLSSGAVARNTNFGLVAVLLQPQAVPMMQILNGTYDRFNFLATTDTLA